MKSGYQKYFKLFKQVTDELIAKPLLSITAHINMHTTHTHMHKLKLRPLNPVTE